MTLSPTQQIFIGAGLVIGLYFVARKAVPEAIEGTANYAGEVLSGEALPSDSPYYGTGIVAVPAATADAVSGGILSRFGSFLGRVAADVTDAVTGRNQL